MRNLFFTSDQKLRQPCYHLFEKVILPRGDFFFNVKSDHHCVALNEKYLPDCVVGIRKKRL